MARHITSPMGNVALMDSFPSAVWSQMLIIVESLKIFLQLDNYQLMF